MRDCAHAGILRGVDSLPDRIPPELEACCRLIKQHVFPAKGSVAELVGLHHLANNGAQDSSAWAINILDEKIAAARAENDAGFFRRYADAIEMDTSGKRGHESLTALLLIAWWNFAREHLRASSREELKVELGLMPGGALSRQFAPRHVRRTFAALREVFEESS